MIEYTGSGVVDHGPRDADKLAFEYDSRMRRAKKQAHIDARLIGHSEVGGIQREMRLQHGD